MFDFGAGLEPPARLSPLCCSHSAVRECCSRSAVRGVTHSAYFSGDQMGIWSRKLCCQPCFRASFSGSSRDGMTVGNWTIIEPLGGVVSTTFGSSAGMGGNSLGHPQEIVPAVATLNCGFSRSRRAGSVGAPHDRWTRRSSNVNMGNWSKLSLNWSIDLSRGLRELARCRQPESGFGERPLFNRIQWSRSSSPLAVDRDR